MAIFRYQKKIFVCVYFASEIYICLFSCFCFNKKLVNFFILTHWEFEFREHFSFIKFVFSLSNIFDLTLFDENFFLHRAIIILFFRDEWIMNTRNYNCVYKKKNRRRFWFGSGQFEGKLHFTQFLKTAKKFKMVGARAKHIKTKTIHIQSKWTVIIVLYDSKFLLTISIC